MKLAIFCAIFALSECSTKLFIPEEGVEVLDHPLPRASKHRDSIDLQKERDLLKKERDLLKKIDDTFRPVLEFEYVDLLDEKEKEKSFFGRMFGCLPMLSDSEDEIMPIKPKKAQAEPSKPKIMQSEPRSEQVFKALATNPLNE